MPNLISVFKHCQSNTQMSVVFFFLFFERRGREHAQKPKFGDSRLFSAKKKLHKALRSVQFLASFISFYVEVLSYLACGEKIINLKIARNRTRNQLVISSLSDMPQDTLFLLSRYMLIKIREVLP